MGKSNISASSWALTPGLLVKDFAEGKVTSTALAVYVTVRLYWGGFEAVFPKQETVAEKAGLSLSQVQRCLRELKSTGWIISERQARVHGNNQYWICDEPFVKPTSLDRGV